MTDKYKSISRLWTCVINAAVFPICRNRDDFSSALFTNVYGYTYKTLSESMKKLILKGYEVNIESTNTKSILLTLTDRFIEMRRLL